MRSGLTAELEISDRHAARRAAGAARGRFAGSATGPLPPWSFRRQPACTGSGGRSSWALSDTTFAEVVSGLEPGDRVVAHAENLPPEDFDPPDPDIKTDMVLATE